MDKAIRDYDKDLKTSHNRYITLEPMAIAVEDKATDTDTLTFSVSSELPVDRWYGKEILSHEAGAINLERLPGMVMLWDHGEDPEMGRRPLGKVTDWRIQDKRGIVTIKWAKKECVEEFRSDVEAGILTNVSFGYVIDEYRVVPGDDEDTIIATKWTPLEVSLVSIPADHTVGIGRSKKAEKEPETEAYKSTIEPELLATETEDTMGEEIQEPSVTQEPSQPATPIVPSVDEKALRHQITEEIRKSESERQLQIRGYAKEFGLQDLGETLINSGKSIAEANQIFMEKLSERNQSNFTPADPTLSSFSAKEDKQYSLLSAIRSLCPGFAEYNKNCFEREVSQEIGAKIGRTTAGVFVPVRHLTVNGSNRGLYGQRNTLNTGGTPSNLIDTELRPQDFIEALRNKAIVFQLGARFMTGLMGPVEIPKQTSTSVANWINENQAIDETSLEFGQVGMSQKTVASIISLTRNLAMQSSLAVENIIREDMIQQIALAIDSAAISGSGVGATPRGILNYNINSVALGATGAAPTYASLVALCSEIESDNADISSMKFLTNTRVKSKLMLTPMQASGVEGNFVLKEGASTLMGYSFNVSNQVPSNLTKSSGSNLSAIILGCWDQLIVGEWGVLEILPNTLGRTYQNGGVEIRALKSLDMCVRHEQSFAAITDAVTTL